MPFYASKRSVEGKKDVQDNILRISGLRPGDFDKWWDIIVRDVALMPPAVSSYSDSLFGSDQAEELKRFAKRFEIGATNHNNDDATYNAYHADLIVRNKAGVALCSLIWARLEKDVKSRVEVMEDYITLQNDGRMDPAKLKEIVRVAVLTSRHTNPLLTFLDLLGEVTHAQAQKNESADAYLIRFKQLSMQLESLAPTRLMQGSLASMREATRLLTTPTKSPSPTVGSTSAVPMGFSESFYVLAAIRGLPPSVREVKNDLLKVFDTGYENQEKDFPKSIDDLRHRCSSMLKRISDVVAEPLPRQHEKRNDSFHRSERSEQARSHLTESKGKDKPKDNKRPRTQSPGQKTTKRDLRADSDRKCFNCNKVGHLRSECPNKPSGANQESSASHATFESDSRLLFRDATDEELADIRFHNHSTFARGVESFYDSWDLDSAVAAVYPVESPSCGVVGCGPCGAGVGCGACVSTGEPVTTPTRLLAKWEPVTESTHVGPGSLRRKHSHSTSIEEDEPEGTIILLDGCANISVVSKEDLCTNVTRVRSHRQVVSTFGEKLEEFKASGTISLGGVRVRVLINPAATANIISERQYEHAAKQQGFSIVREDEGRGSVLKVVNVDTGDVTIRFGWFRGLRATEIFPPASSHLSGYGDEISAEEMAKAIRAREAEEKLGYISTDLMKMALSRGGVVAPEIRPRDAQLAKEAIGVSPIRAKAIATRSAVKLVKITKEYPAVAEQVVHADTFFVNDKEFLLAKAIPMGFISLFHLKEDNSHTLEELKKKLLWGKHLLEDRGYKVTETHFDGDLDQNHTSEWRPSDYPGLVIHPPDQHVGVAERSIRSVKDILRCFVMAKPRLPWSGRFLVEAIASLSFYANLRYSRNTPEAPSPIQQMVGRAVYYDRDIPASLGDLVLVEIAQDDQKKKLVTNPRMEEAVFLRPSMDAHCSAIVLLLRSGKVVKRTDVRKILWTEKPLDDLWKWSGAERTDQQKVLVKKRKKDPEVELRDIAPDDEPEYDRYVTVGADELPARTRHQDGKDLPARTAAQRAALVAQPLVVVPEKKAAAGSRKRPKPALKKTPPQTPYTSSVDVAASGDAEGGLFLREEDDVGWRRSSRSRKLSWRISTTITGKKVETLTTTIAKSWREVEAIADNGIKTQVTDALKAELMNIFVAHPALVPVDRRSIVWGGAEVLPMSFFVDRKYVGGSYVKTKARLVAGGHRQEDETYKLFSSQTVSTESLMIILAVAQYESRSCAVVDVTGAFLNAPMEHPEGKLVYLKLNADLANLFITLSPQHRELLNSDGSLYVRADRAIYGCKQSSFLWQKLLTARLVELGFTISLYDKCVAFRVSDGTVVAFHVDDLFVAAKTPELRDVFIGEFEKLFKITKTIGHTLNYLGMTIEFVDGAIEVNQHAFLEKLIEGVSGSVTTPMVPADAESVDIRPLSADDTALYRSLIAKALYLAKRTRPDILFAVNVLTRAAQAPTGMDKVRFHRLLKYLRFSKHRILKIHTKNIRLTAHIDAAFATHADRKSHTGAIIQLGSALIWAKSVK